MYPSCGHLKRSSSYVNHKGQYTINVQLMCDADLIIRQCVVNLPGSVHDARILGELPFQGYGDKSSTLPGIILGDSGYPLGDRLIIPFLNADTGAKERLNYAH